MCVCGDEMGRGSLKLAVLECDQLQNYLGGNSDGYSKLLQTAFNQVLKNAARVLHPQMTVPPTLSFTAFDVKAEKYPEDFLAFDGVLITGSLSGVYDGDAWIQRLLNVIRELDNMKVKTVGISFGHQAIAEALGGHVGRNPKGSEVSVRKAQVTKEGARVFLPTFKEFRLHYHHNDAILTLPPGFLNLATNNVTEFQSTYKRQQFLTFCGHPEYSHNPEVLEKLLGYDREKLWVPEQLVEHGLTTLSQQTDYEWVIKQILLFFTGALDSFP